MAMLQELKSFNVSPTGEQCEVRAIVSGGSITNVIVDDGGSGYQSPPSYVIESQLHNMKI